MGDIILLSVVLEIKKIFLQIICFQTDWVYSSFQTKEQSLKQADYKDCNCLNISIDRIEGGGESKV